MFNKLADTAFDPLCYVDLLGLGVSKNDDGMVLI